MARRRAHFEVAIAEGDPVPVPERSDRRRGAPLSAEIAIVAAELMLQQPRAGDVIRVHVRIERRNKLQVELAHQRGVAPRLLEHRIDQHRLLASRVAEQIRIGRRLRVEELAEDQHGRF